MLVEIIEGGKIMPTGRIKYYNTEKGFGLVIQHNVAPVVKGKGSAIFLHVWRAPGVPTEGCTAMAKNDLLTLIRWLKPAKFPHLIQVPIDEIRNLTVEGDVSQNINGM